MRKKKKVDEGDRGRRRKEAGISGPEEAVCQRKQTTDVVRSTLFFGLCAIPPSISMS